MHEILTLQLGHPANYAATHFWNTQQSYFTYSEDEEPKPVNHDIHFRPGIGAGGVETYTPRTVIYDLKGGFGSMKKINALYELEEGGELGGGIWHKPVAVQKEPEIGQSPYVQSLELGTKPEPLTTDAVKYWSDFNGVYYHPRSIVQLYQYDINSSVTPFENPQDGRDLLNSIDKEHDILDRDMRFFAEECDMIQGIQVLTTTDDGWGGFASEYLGLLRDEYPKTEIWTWGIQRGEKAPLEKRVPRTLALANALSTLVPLSSIYIPLSSPPLRLPSYVNLDRGSPWHISALLAAAIETFTLQTRMKDQFGRKLTDLSTILNLSGNKNIASLSMMLLDHDQDTTNNLATTSPPEAINLSWHGVEQHVFANVEVARGDFSDKQAKLKQPGNGSVEDEVLVSEFRTDLPYPILESYPRIFRTNSRSSLSLSSTLKCSNVVMDYLKRTKEVVRTYCPVDERESLYNELSLLSSAYQEGWDSGTDSGDDD